MYELLDHIQSPADLKKLSRDQIKQVSNELRQAIIDNLSKTGGHFASDLGAADLMVGLQRFEDGPQVRAARGGSRRSAPHAFRDVNDDETAGRLGLRAPDAARHERREPSGTQATEQRTT